MRKPQLKKISIYVTCLFVVLFWFQAVHSETTNDEDTHRPAIKTAPQRGDQSGTETHQGYMPSTPSPAPRVKTQHEPESSLVPRVLTPSSTRWGDGDLHQTMDPMSIPPLGPFDTDVKVRSTNQSSAEVNQTMVSDSEGNLYIAWQDDYPGYQYIQVYKSTDGGQTWGGFKYVHNPSADLLKPSLAIGEGSQDTLLLAYIVDDGGTTIPHPEVATRSLTGEDFTIHSVPYWAWEGYDSPVIWTDSVYNDEWHAYLTCEGINEAATDDINVCFWRSTDYGATWGDDQVIRGNTDSYAWLDPDGTYGCTTEDLFIVCYNADDQTLYLDKSTDDGVTFSTNIAINTLANVPSQAVDPEIAAAINEDNVMVCCTIGGSGNDNIGQTYSTDGGATWSTLYSLEGHTTADEYGVALTANEGGNSWHLAYTRIADEVCYSRRPQDLSYFWQFTPEIVTDAGSVASPTYPQKGIASNWDTDIPTICWADYRDGAPDYDTYADSKSPATPSTIPCDYDADGQTDIGVYRPSTGGWYLKGSTVGYQAVTWGGDANDVPVPEDYNGDGATDIAVYRSSTGWWYVRGMGSYLYGAAGDIPVPGDYDGDGAKDFGVYDSSTGWWYIKDVGNFLIGGLADDIPVPGDYDGDGSIDIAVYRSSTGWWYIKGMGQFLFGGDAGDIPVPGDYDGNGTTDIGIYRPSTGWWYIRGVGSYLYIGVAGDIPVPGDYDGDGTIDIAVFRPSTQQWFIKGGTTATWGGAGDTPLTRNVWIWQETGLIP